MKENRMRNITVSILVDETSELGRDEVDFFIEDFENVINRKSLKIIDRNRDVINRKNSSLLVLEL